MKKLNTKKSNPVQKKLYTQRNVINLMKSAWLHGFNHSGEGSNGEYFTGDEKSLIKASTKDVKKIIKTGEVDPSVILRTLLELEL